MLQEVHLQHIVICRKSLHYVSARAPINALSTNIKSLLEDQVFYDRDYGRYYCANKGCTAGYKKVVTYYDYAEAIYNISVDLNFPLIFRYIKTPCFHNEGF